MLPRLLTLFRLFKVSHSLCPQAHTNTTIATAIATATTPYGSSKAISMSSVSSSSSSKKNSYDSSNVCTADRVITTSTTVQPRLSNSFTPKRSFTASSNDDDDDLGYAVIVPSVSKAATPSTVPPTSTSSFTSNTSVSMNDKSYKSSSIVGTKSNNVIKSTNSSITQNTNNNNSNNYLAISMSGKSVSEKKPVSSKKLKFEVQVANTNEQDEIDDIFGGL